MAKELTRQRMECGDLWYCWQTLILVARALVRAYITFPRRAD